MMLLLILACTQPTDTGFAPGLVDVELTPVNGPYLMDVRLEMASPGPVAVACTAEDDESEVHLIEAEAQRARHKLRFSGLRAETRYRCRLLPEGGSFEFTTEAGTYLHDEPMEIVEGEPRFVLGSLSRNCDPGQQDPMVQLVVFDERGRVRWAWEPPGDLHGDVAVHHEGAGIFSWGGGDSVDGAPGLVDLTGEIQSRMVLEPGSAYHHEGRLVEGGLLGVVKTEIQYAGGTFDGSDVVIQDPETLEEVWRWSGQEALRHGEIQGGTGDAWHINGAVRRGDTVALSVCKTDQILGIDVPTGRLSWSITGKTQCQHGVDLRDDRLLVYDNAWRRPSSRVVELSVPGGEELWEWTEPDWREVSYGDADYLENGNVLVTQAHVDCNDGRVDDDLTGLLEVDRGSGEVVWRLQWSDPYTTIYRTDSLLPCALFDDVATCPALAERLEELGG